MSLLAWANLVRDPQGRKTRMHQKTYHTEMCSWMSQKSGRNYSTFRWPSSEQYWSHQSQKAQTGPHSPVDEGGSQSSNKTLMGLRYSMSLLKATMEPPGLLCATVLDNCRPRQSSSLVSMLRCQPSCRRWRLDQRWRAPGHRKNPDAQEKTYSMTSHIQPEGAHLYIRCLKFSQQWCSV